MKRRDFSTREISLLLRGKFIPFKASESVMKKRLRDLKKAYPNEIINKDFFYPRKDFNRIMRKYRNRSLKSKETGPSLFDKISDIFSSSPTSKVEPMSTNIQTSRVQAPPLPKTPMPNRKLVASMPQINQQTGLTQTEAALLSPSEQVIARRT